VLRDNLMILEQKQPDQWSTYHTRSVLGAALLGQAKYDEAEPLLLAGYEGMKQREPKIPAASKVGLLIEAAERLVRLYDARGQKDATEAWRKRLEEAKAAKKTLKKT
jgi:hypothetical protein